MQRPQDVRLVSIRCYGASEQMLLNFKIPKEKSRGSYEVKCMISAFNPTSTEAHIYAEFERVKSNLLERALERHGATGIGIESFTLQDYLTGSGNALRFVLTKATETGFQLIENGRPSIAPAPATDPTPLQDTFPLEVFKALEQTVDKIEERAQKLEDELNSKDDELRLSNEETYNSRSKNAFEILHASVSPQLVPQTQRQRDARFRQRE